MCSFYHPVPTFCPALRIQVLSSFWVQFLHVQNETAGLDSFPGVFLLEQSITVLCFSWWQHMPGTFLSPQRESDTHLLQYMNVPILPDSFGRNNRFTCQL